MHHGFRRPLVNHFTHNNQLKMGGRVGGEGGEEGQTWGSGRGMPMRQVYVWKVRGATYRIVDDPTLLGHDAERHDPNTEMTASKIAGKPELT